MSLEARRRPNRFQAQPGDDETDTPTAYGEALRAMHDGALYAETYAMILEAAKAYKNPLAECHGRVDALYNEIRRRDPEGRLYELAYEACVRDHGA